MEGRDLLRGRQPPEVVVAQRHRSFDETVDGQRPARRIEDRHRPGDRVDAPAADREDVAQKLRATRRERREDPARRRCPGERGQAAREHAEENTTTVTTRLEALSGHSGLTSRYSRRYVSSAVDEEAVERAEDPPRTSR